MNKFLKGEVVVQTIKPIDRKAFVQLLIIDKIFFKIIEIIHAPYTEYAIVENIHTKETLKVCCEYLRTLTSEEKALLAMEEKFPEIVNIFA